MTIVSFELTRRYGDDVRMRFLNLSEPDVRAEHADAIALIESRGLCLPATFINGEPFGERVVMRSKIVDEVAALLGGARTTR